MLNLESLLAIGIIAAALTAAWTRKFLATGALVLANIFVHLLSALGRVVDITFQGQLVGRRSVIQHELGLHGDLLSQGEPVAFLQLVTSMFVHADFFHLLGNVIILLAFALPFEERIGHRAFLVMYLVSGLVGALAQTATSWGDPILLMGASGAVFGIIGAFAGTYPRLVLPLPLPLGFFMIFVRMRVMVAAAIFGGLQLLYLQFLSPFDNTAYMAHIGGLVGGLAVAGLYLRRRQANGPSPASGPLALNLEKMRPFAKTLAAQNALARLAMCSDEPVLAATWLEKFVEHGACPQGGPITLDKGHVVCPDGHRFDVRA